MRMANEIKEDQQKYSERQDLDLKHFDLCIFGDKV